MLEPSFFYARLRRGVDLKLASPSAALRLTKTPVLFIAGTADTNVADHHSRDLYSESKDNSELWASNPQEFEKRVIDWFARH